MGRSQIPGNVPCFLGPWQRPSDPWAVLKKLSLCTNSDFVIPIFFLPDGVNLWYFKLRLFDLTEFIVWNIYLRVAALVAKILRLENHSLWQRLNSFRILQEILSCLKFIVFCHCLHFKTVFSHVVKNLYKLIILLF